MTDQERFEDYKKTTEQPDMSFEEFQKREERFQPVAALQITEEI